MVSLLILASALAYSEPTAVETEVKVAMAFAMAKETPAPTAKPMPTYADAVKEAEKTGKVLVVFVGTASKPGVVPDGALMVQTQALPGVKQPTVFVSAFVDGKHVGHPLPPNATHGEVIEKVNELQPAPVRRIMTIMQGLPGTVSACPNGRCPLQR